MGEKAEAKKVVETVARGVITGLLYYLMYTLLLPTVLSKILGGGLQEPVPQAFWILALAVFTGLGTANALLKEHPTSLPLKLLTKILGCLIILFLLNFGILEGQVTSGGAVIDFRVDVLLPLYTIVLFIMLAFP